MPSLPGFFLFILTIVFSLPLHAQVSEMIRLNQEGYYSTAPKEAILVGEIKADIFFVISEKNNDTVFSGRPGTPMASKNSSLICRSIAFTPVHKAGRYHIHIPGIGRSYPFVISDQALHPAAIASLKGYYFQRVSMPLEAPFAGKWAWFSKAMRSLIR